VTCASRRQRGATVAYELQIHRRVGFTDLLIAALGDDVEAQGSASAIIGWITRFNRGGGADCFVCGATLQRPPAAIVLMMPVRRADRQAVAGGLCTSCLAQPRPVLLDGVMSTLTSVMPSARLHVVTGQGGRA
jgi:hypothetical protein